MAKESKEKESKTYRINICDGYFCTKDRYCYTLYNIRSKKATPLKPNVDESETTEDVLGYFTDFNSMLWSIVKNKTDNVALSKDKNIELIDYISIFENAKDEILTLTNIKA